MLGNDTRLPAFVIALSIIARLDWCIKKAHGVVGQRTRAGVPWSNACGATQERGTGGREDEVDEERWGGHGCLGGLVVPTGHDKPVAAGLVQSENWHYNVQRCRNGFLSELEGRYGLSAVCH